MEKFQISLQLSCGKIEIAQHVKKFMHHNLKFLHMTIFSTYLIYVIYVTNNRYVLMLMLMLMLML